jgi:5-methylcytosine-specific restriction endonuclease McrA
VPDGLSYDERQLVERVARPGTSFKARRDKRGCADDREWRTAVFVRDGFKCVQCGKGGRLQADHIQPVASHPELRHVLSNGRTLCVPCHKKTPTYGWRGYWARMNEVAAKRLAQGALDLFGT